jgi:hypothetical protein
MPIRHVKTSGRPNRNPAKVGGGDWDADHTGGVSAVADPGIEWQPSHAYNVGDQVSVTGDGVTSPAGTYVYECVKAGTSNSDAFHWYGD